MNTPNNPPNNGPEAELQAATALTARKITQFLSSVGAEPLHVRDNATTGPQLFENPQLDPETRYGIGWKLSGQTEHVAFELEVYAFDEVAGNEATDDRMIDIRLHAAEGDNAVDSAAGGIGGIVWYERGGKVFADCHHGSSRSDDLAAQAELAELSQYLGLTEADMFGTEKRPNYGFFGAYNQEQITRLGEAFDKLNQDRELLGVSF